MNVSLQPLPYHYRIRDYLKSGHRDLWNWFSSTEAESDFSEAVQLELLKSTYRLNRPDHEELYGLCDEVRDALELDVPVTLYQSQDGGGPEQATLYFTPGHGHVVFGGKILSLLEPAERKALLGHELAHFRLWVQENGDFLIADRILIQMAGDARCEPSHFHSARLYRLYTEIYADRGCLLVSDSAETGVSTLIKSVTGTKEVNPTAYLEQAVEIFAKSEKNLKSGAFSHPENFIRARAMQLWAEVSVGTATDFPESGVKAETSEKAIELQIEHLIEGAWSLNELDITRQERLTGLTREVLLHLLEPEWVRTGRTISHAKLYFSDFDPAGEKEFTSMEAVAGEFKGADKETRHFLTHLFLDFAVADRDLEENGLALAFDAAEKFGLADDLETAARSELKLLKRDLTALRKEIPKRLEAAAVEFENLSKEEKKAIQGE